MVVKMMKWRPWPPLSSKKFEAKITVHQLKGGLWLHSPSRLFCVEIKWKGPKAISLRRRTSVRRNFTKEEPLSEDGIVEWDEDFQCVRRLSPYKDGVLHPWEVTFTVFNASKQGPNGQIHAVATGTLNLADFANSAVKQDGIVSIPLSVNGSDKENPPSLCLSIILLELRTAEEPAIGMQKPAVSFPLSPCFGENSSPEKEENHTLKASLRRVNIFKGLSSRKSKKTGKEEEGSENMESSSQLDTVSSESDGEVNHDAGIRRSFSYGSLVYVNHAGVSSYSNTSSSEDEDLIYYSHRKSDAGQTYLEDSKVSVLDPSSQKRGILPWKKRKLTFRSMKVRGEPLLKKSYGEEGGDDIDFDRRQLSSSGELVLGKTEEDKLAKNSSSASAFGDDNFAVGSWEQKEVISRNGHMKLQTQVFFGSIDQRSERATGESACTALVAVIAYWLHSNPDEMPFKSLLDSMIRDGSSEWRKLCENKTYMDRFPDKHFDLETVLEAEVRPISVLPDKSFIGFFHPEGVENHEGLDFLLGAMSFDNIWNEISQPDTSGPSIYIISWNDHFFVLKVERDAYYIIDSLGERLYEGCNQAFILKFDRETIICQNQLANAETHKPDDKPASDDKAEENSSKGGTSGGEIVVSNSAPGNNDEEMRIVCEGKESCKEYIKSFLAAIPLRELEDDLKKKVIASAPLHHRLQIEFHYTRPIVKSLVVDADVIEAIASKSGKQAVLLPLTE